MKTSLGIFGVGLLSFVGFTALYGGWALMIDPTGELLHIPVDKTRFFPFDNYFIPGAILFIVLGLGSLLLLPIVLKGTPKATNAIILAGVTLSSWIIIQMIMLLEINWLHGIYLTIGIGLILLGLRKKTSTGKN